MRISRGDYFMGIAKLVAMRSPCLSRKVGAVIVGNNRIISTGYNGPPSGHPHCIKCYREVSGKGFDTCPAIHSEANAIIEAAKSTNQGDTIYVTTEPCFSCCKLLAQYKIKTIIYLEPYPTSFLCNQFLSSMKITKEQYEQSKH